MVVHETARKPVDKLRMRPRRLAFGTPKALTFRTDSHVFGVPNIADELGRVQTFGMPKVACRASSPFGMPNVLSGSVVMAG